MVRQRPVNETPGATPSKVHANVTDAPQGCTEGGIDLAGGCISRCVFAGTCDASVIDASPDAPVGTSDGLTSDGGAWQYGIEQLPGQDHCFIGGGTFGVVRTCTTSSAASQLLQSGNPCAVISSGMYCCTAAPSSEPTGTLAPSERTTVVSPPGRTGRDGPGGFTMKTDTTTNPDNVTTDDSIQPWEITPLGVVGSPEPRFLWPALPPGITLEHPAIQAAMQRAVRQCVTTEDGVELRAAQKPSQGCGKWSPTVYCCEQ
jgi:hypothetical protein